MRLSVYEHAGALGRIGLRYIGPPGGVVRCAGVWIDRGFVRGPSQLDKATTLLYTYMSNFVAVGNQGTGGGDIFKLRIKGNIKNVDTLRALKEVYWQKLHGCEPFVRGAIHTVGAGRGNARQAYSLARREGARIENAYFPANELKEMRRRVDNYRRAKELLSKIADCELAIIMADREAAARVKPNGQI